MTDHTDGVWIRDYVGPRDETVTWRRFSVAGEYVGKAVLPVSLDVLETGTDYLLGRYHDELDVAHVQLFAFAVTEPSVVQP